MISIFNTSDKATLSKQIEQYKQEIQRSLEFVKNIEQGNLDVEYEGFDKENDTKNHLAVALVSMRDHMKVIAEHEKQRNWVTEGLAKFIDILRSDSDNSEKLYQNIISGIVKYLNANQGGIFVINDDNENDQYLELLACYAYEKKKYIEKRVDIFEGVIGQCYNEQEIVYLKKVPEDYVHITSGTGEIPPTNILLVPIKIDKLVLGVIEIASFYLIADYQIEFLVKLSESIASTVSNVKTAKRTQKLLADLQEKNDVTHEQENTLQQNMEELRATEEELKHQFSLSEKLKVQLLNREEVINQMMIVSESDLNGTITYANEALCRISKYTQEELIGHGHNIFRHPEVPKALFKLMWDTLKAGQSFRGVVKNKAKDGSVYWVDAFICPGRNDKNEIDKYISTRYHITDAAFAEKRYNDQNKALGLA